VEDSDESVRRGSPGEIDASTEDRSSPGHAVSRIRIVPGEGKVAASSSFSRRVGLSGFEEWAAPVATGVSRRFLRDLNHRHGITLG
jgi:hypothetical protein